MDVLNIMEINVNQIEKQKYNNVPWKMGSSRVQVGYLH